MSEVDTTNRQRFRSPLRDLVAEIEQVARRHACFSQAHGPVQNLVNHLSAMARIEELHHRGHHDA